MRAVQYVIDQVIETEPLGTWIVCLEGRILARFAARDAAIIAARQLAAIDCVTGKRAEVHVLGSGSRSERVYCCNGTLARRPAERQGVDGLNRT